VIGTSLSQYRITAALGAGGMGEVWRADDTKLGREVALKVLPESFAADDDRHGRFEREAKTLASLNHPNIATLYGLEHLDGRHVLVMELVKGEDLAARIARGPLPVDEAVAIARQIGDALEAAHQAGIVHRDLKPANVRIRPDGAVKVLDFGLAKAWTPAGGMSSSPASATLVGHVTVAGVILGTAAYMSPESARGREVDRRADVWAFGAVIWEMLTGQPLFQGDTLSDVLAAVLTSEPDWQALEKKAGAAVARVVRGCLEKDPRQRFTSAADVALLLDRASHDDARPAVRGRQWTPARRAAAALAGAGLLVAGAVGGIAWRGRAADPGPAVTRSAVVDPDLVVSSGIALSADGRRLAFVVERESGNVLAVRALDRFDPVVLPGTEGAMCPFFSPDGAWLGYFTRTELRKVPVGGGSPRTIATFGGGVRFDPWNSASYPTADWGNDDTIVYSSGFWRQPSTLTGLWAVPAAGGEPRALTHLDGTELGHRWPTFTPDGRHVAFTALGVGPRNTHIDLVERASGRRRRLHEGGAGGRVLRSGYLVYLDSFYSRLAAVAIDLRTLETTAAGTPLIEGVSTSPSQSYAVSRDGTLAYVAAGPGNQENRVVRVGLDGSVATLVERGGNWYQPRMSPDGRRLVVREVGDECRLWLFDLGRRTLTPLTTSGDNHQPIWSRGGREVVFGREDSSQGARGISRQVADGSLPPEELVSGGAGDRSGGAGVSSVPYPDSFSPGDRELLYEQSTLATGSDLWVMPMSGRVPVPFLASPAFEGDGAISPDGRWVAYVSDESGRQEVYVRTYPEKGGRLQVSVAGGEWPLWSHDGTRLFFSQGRRLMAVTFSGDGPEASADRPQAVLEGFDFGRGTLDVMPDGSGFVLVQPTSRGLVEIRLVAGWTRELRETVPADSRHWTTSP
jgi:serine/threonine-protein kinase